MNFTGNELNRRGFASILCHVVRATSAFFATTFTLATRTPAFTSRCSGSITLFSGLFTRGIVRPSRGDFTGLEYFFAGSICPTFFFGTLGRRRCGGRFVQSTCQRCSLWLRTHNFARTIQHLTQSGGFSLGSASRFITSFALDRCGMHRRDSATTQRFCRLCRLCGRSCSSHLGDGFFRLCH